MVQQNPTVTIVGLNIVWIYREIHTVSNLIPRSCSDERRLREAVPIQ